MFENSNVGSDHQQLTMQVMQNVARRYGLVCLLHEKPFAGVNGSGKHNNWSMGTDSGKNLLEPGDTPHENLAVPVLLRGRDPGGQQAPGPAAGVDRVARPGPSPRGQRGAAGDHLDLPRRRAREGVRGDRARRGSASRRPSRSSGLGTPVLPPLPMHGGDRNRTSPFAFTGNKFEFRALGSSMSLSLPNTVLNTIVAEAIDDLAEELEDALATGAELEAALRPILQRSYAANKQIIFGGDNYSEEWHAEAEQRGLLNLRATPDALPYLIADDTMTLFSNYGVLSRARARVALRGVRSSST